MHRSVATFKVTALTLTALLGVCVSLGQLATAAQTATSPPRVSQDDQAYMCPMHPDVVADTPGNCPRCRMELVLGRPYDMRDYRVELRTTPRVVKAGQKATLDLTVRHPGTGEVVRAFSEVHEK